MKLMNMFKVLAFYQMKNELILEKLTNSSIKSDYNGDLTSRLIFLKE